MVTSVLSGGFLLAGAFFMLVAGIGVLRMPDVFTRLHAAGMKDTLGSAFTLVGFMLISPHWLVTVKLLIIWGLLWFTCSVASHSVARAALRAGVQPILGDAARATDAGATPGTNALGERAER